MREFGIVALTAGIIVAILYALHQIAPNLLGSMMPNIGMAPSMGANPADLTMGPTTHAPVTDVLGVSAVAPPVDTSMAPTSATVTTPTQQPGVQLHAPTPMITAPGSAFNLPQPAASAFNRQPPKAVAPASFSGYHVPIVGVHYTTPSYARAHNNVSPVSTNRYSVQNLRPQAPSAGTRTARPATVAQTPAQQLRIAQANVASGTVSGSKTTFARATKGTFSPRYLYTV